MKHLIICREYPPAPSGGIGTYVVHISRLLAESGETVHVIGQIWEGAEKEVEEKYDGRLIIHRVPFQDWTPLLTRKPSSRIKSKEAMGLFKSSFPPQCFAWQASLLTENLVEQEGIDIIEAQEFEAPLYFLQLRRALGLGPKRRPPCIVHLHSPMEFIARYNDWDVNHAYFQTAKRLEDYSIAAADALLCPSRYLARQIETHYGLAKESVQVIPLPIGDNPLLDRDKDTWGQGSVLYMGRLERRKGVLEWIDAAVAIAPDYPTVRFEFVGANVLGIDGIRGEELVEQRIPKGLKTRFDFRGEQKRSSLPQFLAQARIAVVPSRWENFPNTCVEAMCSGLPVIASRDGGMAEMIEDGRTGWLAHKAGSEGLTEALKRALETPPERIAEMGVEASSAIRQMCDNKKTLERHLDFRSRIVNQGPNRSLHLPVNLPWIKSPLLDSPIRQTAQKGSKEGLAIVVICLKGGHLLDKCLQTIKQQTRKPVAVVIVGDGSVKEQTLKALNLIHWGSWQVIRHKNRDVVSAKNAGIKAVLDSGFNPLGFVFLRVEGRLRPDFIASCESVLQRCPEVGLVSFWVHHPENDNRALIKPCPSFPYQWHANGAVPFSVIRTEALHEAGNFRLPMSQGYEDWDLFNAVMAAGWIAVTVPEILADYPFVENSMSLDTVGHTYVRMRKELLERFPDLVARDAKDIVLLAESDKAWSPYRGSFIPQKQRLVAHTIKMARIALLRPRWTTLAVLKTLKKKALRCTPLWISNLISRVSS